MYHIKSDERSQKSAQRIYQALVHCLTRQSLEQITITDLTRCAEIGRATFYRHFDNITDVLYWQCDYYFAQLYADYRPQPAAEQSDSYHFVRYLLAYWLERSEILEILLAAGRTDIIYQCHLNHFDNFARQYSPHQSITSEHYPYAIAMRSGIMTGILTAWLSSRKKQTAEEVFAIIREQFEQLKNAPLLL